MEMLSGGSVSSFISATALIWAALIILIMIGIVYFLKEKKGNKDLDEKLFIALYFDTLFLNIFEFILYFVMQLDDSFFKTLCFKIYIFLGFLWSILILYYIISYLREINTKKAKYLYFGSFLILIFISIILCLVFPVEATLEIYGKFYTLTGTLNTIYNRFGIISNFILLVVVISNSKKISKSFVFLSIFIFAMYITNFALESIFGYNIKESIFIYSLLVLSLFNTIANQDEYILNDLNNVKNSLEKLNKVRDTIIYKLSYEMRNTLNNIVLNSDCLVLGNSINELELKDSCNEISNVGTSLYNYIDNIQAFSKMQNNDIVLDECDFELKTLIDDISNYVLPVLNAHNIKLNCYYDQNLPIKYNGDYKKIEKMLINLILNSVNDNNSGVINLNINGIRLDNKNIELSILLNCGIKYNDNLLSLELSDLINSNDKLGSNILEIVLAKYYSKVLNCNISVSSNSESSASYEIKLNQKYMI